MPAPADASEGADGAATACSEGMAAIMNGEVLTEDGGTETGISAAPPLEAAIKCGSFAAGRGTMRGS